MRLKDVMDQVESEYTDEMEVVAVKNLWNGTSYIVGNEIFDSREEAESALDRFNSTSFTLKFAGPKSQQPKNERNIADEFYKKQIPPKRSKK